MKKKLKQPMMKMMAIGDNNPKVCRVMAIYWDYDGDVTEAQVDITDNNKWANLVITMYNDDHIGVFKNSTGNLSGELIL